MRLLLVDDEIFVRERILQQIDWNTLGVHEIKTAQNGVAALRLMQHYQPDILISDVRMPQMDGIKLAEEVQHLYADCKVIFVSGYPDVPYLRSAIRLKAINYVEKPVDIGELSMSIQNAAHDIQNDRMAQNGMQAIKQKNEGELKTSIVKGLTQKETACDAAKLLRTLPNTASCHYWATALVQILDLREDANLTDDEIKKDLQKSFPDPQVQAIGFLRKDKIIIQLLFRSADSKRKDVLAPYFTTLTTLLYQRGLTCVSTIGKFVKDAETLYLSYHTALQVLPRCFYKYPGYLGMFQQYNNKPFDLTHLSMTEFAHALKKDDKQALLFLINNLSTQIKQYSSTSPHEVRRFYYSIIMLMLRSAQKENIQLCGNLPDEYAVLNLINQMHFFDELHDFTIKTVHLYYEKVNNNLTGNSIVNHILRYLDQNYHDPDLSVTMVSTYVKLSSTYVCHLFKSTMDITLGDYLTQLRIDKAVELMQTNDYKVKEIAQKVGYRNGNYFSYRFKKIMGYSPGRNA